MIATKNCTKCGKDKPIGDFVKDRTKKDGYRRMCKACQRKYNQSTSAKAARRKYAKTERGKITSRKASKAHRKTEKGKSTHKRYSDRNPQKRRAKDVVHNAVRTGNLPRANTHRCADCGKQAAHYHHESYNKKDWLNVVPLCAKCHKARHQTS